LLYPPPTAAAPAFGAPQGGPPAGHAPQGPHFAQQPPPIGTPWPATQGTSALAHAPVSIGVHQHAPQELRAAHAHIVRGRAYAFVLDAHGNPIEIGSGRFGKVYLGEERWLDSKTDFRRQV